MAGALAAALMAGACGSGGAASAIKPRPALSGSLTVFAAASLTEAFNQEKATLARSAPALILTYSFAGSQTLAQQIIQGARADLFASADDRTMQRLVDAKLVEAPRVFARNQLEIVVAPGNPRHVSGLRDLARPDLVVVLEDPTVPAGSYSQQALAKAEVRVRPRSLELDVKSALSKVTSGEADAAIVYASDVQAAGSKASGVAIPAGQNVVATYPIAVVRTSSNHAGAAAFVQEVLSGSGQAALEAHGFLPAS
jgi:molybdate transport system substrate-binding protein